MATDSNRNLLFGILALQMDFISREQLIAATSVWLQEKSRPLEEILLEQNALSEADRQLLAPLVARHIENHDGDAERSLASISSIGSVAEQLISLGDPQIEATLSLVGRDKQQYESAERKTDDGSPASGESRFRILRPHAKGGLGEVSVAEDTELSREVALKEIQTRFADDPQSRSRFVLEAEVTGGLEHPGIVPVYGLGQYSDGRPFYAMRFIRGDSLKDAAARFHNMKEPVDYTGIAFRKLLGRFIDVCNAIEYAHSRGVLHRDLKPGNIMLGKYGETLVVDWGLAKLQGRDDAAKVEGETTLNPSSGSGVEPTQMGSAIGTPAYMPPEQAAGNPEQLGPASDVYSLGATLYHLLTGRSPVKGKDLGEVLQRVQDGDFPPPRQVKPDIPKSLEAICLQAMSTRPQDRYASPRELADDMERYLADDPVTAFPDPLVDRARRWVRKHQTLAVTTAAVILVSALGLGVFSTIVSGKNRELTQANKRESDARREAEANELAARQQGQLALTTLTSVINDVQDGLRNLSGGGEIRRRLLNTSLAKLDAVATQYVEKAQVDRATTIALIEMGDLVMKFGVETTDASKEGNADAGITEGQKSAVKLAGRLFRRAHQIREKLAADDPSNAQAQRDLSASYNKIGRAQFQLGQSSEALTSYQRSLEIREKLAADDPANAEAQRDLSISLDKIGDVQLQSGQSSEALESYQKSQEVGVKLAADDPANTEAQRDLSVSYNKIGDIQLRAGRTMGALASYQKSLEIREKLAADNPGNAKAQRDLSVSYSKIGDVQLQSEQSDEALKSYQKSLGIDERQAADDPSNAQAHRDLSVSYNKIGDVQLQSGQSDEALKFYQKSLGISEKLADDDPANAEAQRDLSIMHNDIGDVQLQSGQSDEALKSYQKSLGIDERLAAGDPSNAVAQRDLSVSYNNIGDVQLQSGQSDEALESYQKSLGISTKLAADDLNNAEAQRDLMISHYKLGEAHEGLGDYETAAAEYELGAAVLRRMIDQGMNVEDSREELAILEEAAATATQAHIALGDWDELLSQPKETLPSLLILRSREFTKNRSRFVDAAKAVAKLRTLEGVDDGQLYSAACYLSLCAASIKANGGETLSAEQTKLREQYIADALATLKQSVDAGWDDFDHMQEDSDLEILREHAEFKALIPQTDEPDDEDK